MKERHIFVSLGFTDMRKQINGLSVIVQQSCKDGPFTGSYYIFCGRTRKILKILYWDRTGFCLWQKRLERDSFPWPRNKKEITEITRQQLRLVLRGIDVWKEHEKLEYTSVM
jgi:transposase